MIRYRAILWGDFMYYYFIINNQEDFESIRKLVEGRYFSNKMIIDINKDILFDGKLIPIDARDFDIVINGHSHTLIGLRVNFTGSDRDNLDNSGIFSKANSLNVYDLNIENAYIYGGVKCGTFAGHVEGDVLLERVNLDDVIVNSEAFAGGAVGRCNSLEVSDSKFNVSVYGHDVVGGVAGMATKYIHENNEINTEGIAVGKAIGNETGYCEIKLNKKNMNL